MNESISDNLVVLIALAAIFAIVVLIPQTIGYIFYRFLRSRAAVVAALIGFAIPVLYCAILVCLWYNALPPSNNEFAAGGEGDIVIPAILFLGSLANIFFAAFLYGSLLLRNLAAAKDR